MIIGTCYDDIKKIKKREIATQKIIRQIESDISEILRNPILKINWLKEKYNEKKHNKRSRLNENSKTACFCLNVCYIKCMW